MSDLRFARIGCAMTGSFCTFAQAFEAWRELKNLGASLTPIMSENAYSLDTRFYTARAARETFADTCGKEIIHTIPAAEPIGPGKLLDLLIIAPCTGNTLAKIACGIADTAVTMAVKSHLRNERPVLIAVSTNDALARGAKNIGAIMNMKHMFFVPLTQDAPFEKPASLIARFSLLREAAEMALAWKQLQPLIVTEM